MSSALNRDGHEISRAQSGVTRSPDWAIGHLSLQLLARKRDLGKVQRVKVKTRQIRNMRKLIPRPLFGSAQELRLSQAITQNGLVVSSLPRRPGTPRPSWDAPTIAPQVLQCRGAKTKTVRKLKDLAQGVIQADPLPELETDDAMQYPTVVQGAKNNMIKFSNCVVLTRVGNFYELYLEHAEQYGPLLNLKVGWKKTKTVPVAMAGFPFYQLDRFLKILVQDLNKYVAISEEYRIAMNRQPKSGGLLFDRRVARVVTPGTLIDEKFIDPYENNFLLAIHVTSSIAASPKVAGKGSIESHESPTPSTEAVGLAWVDLSTGEFFTQSINTALLSSALARIGAREIILDQHLAESLKQKIQLLIGHHHLVTFHDCATEFESMSEWAGMLESPVLPVAEAAFSEEEKLAGHNLLDYVQTRIQGLQVKLQPPYRRQHDEVLTIDRNSMRGLEILETAKDGLGKGSLLHAIRRTTTKSGARLLRDRITWPSASLTEINKRLDLVTMFLDDARLREEVVELLRRSFDAQRLVQKFSLNKGDADDLICLARAIDASEGIRKCLERELHGPHVPVDEAMASLEDSPISWLLGRVELDGPVEVARRISAAIDEEGLSRKHRLEEDQAATVAAHAQEIIMNDALPEEIETLPKKLRTQSKVKDLKDQGEELEDTWIMRVEASENLMRLHDDLISLRQEKAKLAEELAEKLKTPSLTLKWTPGLGHICHVKGVSKVPLESLNARIVSSTKSTRSFYLPEWSALGGRIDNARFQIRMEEQSIFTDLQDQVIRNLVKIRRNAVVLDELDVACSFAALAHEQSLVRPILNMGTNHRIVGGRHPTVKLGLEEQGRSFVSNDLFIGEKDRIWLVTGPNMAGKSTFLRQNALISILAQVGSYVPAEHAEIGLVDQIFSRVGAADDLFRDQSTFMVEMLETAAILKQATPRSFVIMDEVGRGTAPEDGTAVSFACLHHLHYINKCRTLFATHFHALADMTRDFSNLGRYCTDVIEDEDGSFSFVHRLRPGVNRQSHALKVARLAGMPESTIVMAKQVLEQLDGEKGLNCLPNREQVDHEPLMAGVAS